MSVEVIIFGDSEDILRVAVQRDLQKIDGKLWPVGTKVPNPRPNEFVIIRRVGGIQRDLVTDEPTILVEVWAATETRAVRVAQIIRGLLHSYSQIGEYSILGCDEISGPVNLPDGLSAQVRYTATYVVAIRSNETVST
ncbi:tail terminator [Arthrobacter phage Savage2526]|uniref:Tail terminator n=7 Tax=Korravirus TaxID=1982076 RepID=A0A0U4B2I0_9CAUD|nr:tail terminator [Arthrobacter phage Glenn]ALY10033.1 tail terminator [Arthrobacter phage RAP15]AOT24104.1 tail terminator [Arthrobacter phage Vallejo]ATW58950.1 tail terminator [Arthrobacter phage MeganNoll]AZS09706.1 tail terminator [Arthrobacter phage Riverdale]AZS10129.1 tail terminator [Arthrobacter phage Savage2526]AZS10554.1 tail terminator [Arthrobacter phage TattModd]WAB10062.1 tail terminator [Arthrobacter phage Jumboset]